MKKNSRTAILIASYDGAEDLWKPLSQTYKKYWADCPFQIYLGTNYKEPDVKPFIPLIIGEEQSWSDNILKCLKKIEEEYILLIFDDVFLYKKINNLEVTNLVNMAEMNNWSYLRLSPHPSFDEAINSEVGRIKEDRLYRTSTAWAVFKKEVLIDLLNPTESAWDFEIIGSERSNKYPDFYGVNKVYLPYLNGVVKGKWVRSVFKYLTREGIEVTDKKIKQMSFIEGLIFELIKIRSKIFAVMIPKSMQLNLRRYFKS